MTGVPSPEAPLLPLEEPVREWHLPGGHLQLWPTFLVRPEADRLLAELWREVRWSQHFVRIAGRRMPCPRLSAWYGADGATYAYSGQSYVPLPFFPSLDEVRIRVEEIAGARFNSVLANAYRDGADSMGWHADDEPELGPEPVIASVSLGETRRFRLRRRDRGAKPVEIDLAHGSLLRMGHATQRHWEHAVPKTRRPVGLRINLTFRWIEAGRAPASPASG